MKARNIVKNKADLADAIGEYGILPFFSNRVSGWSLEEIIDPGKWFTDDDGPWEWKGQLAYDKICVYGKFIRGKAAFVSPEWFAHLANYRRNGYSFHERVEEELVPYKDKLLMDYVTAHPAELSKHAKRECGFSQGYDGVLTRLQMQTYIVNQDFRYSIDKQGKPYGWGNAALITPEDWLGPSFLSVGSHQTPQESFDSLFNHLREAMPGVDEVILRKELR